MTIKKAIALAALTGTLALGPQLAFAQSADHGNSGAAHTQNDARKSEQASDKATRASERASDKAARDAAKTERQQNKQDADADDDENTTGTTNSSKLNFGRVISTIRHGGDLSEIANVTADGTVTVYNLDEVLRGNNVRALENALKGTSPTDVQNAISANPNITLPAGTDLSTVVFADVDANGNLIVYTRSNT